jgi:hypothetical protein
MTGYRIRVTRDKEQHTWVARAEVRVLFFYKGLGWFSGNSERNSAIAEAKDYIAKCKYEDALGHKKEYIYV